MLFCSQFQKGWQWQQHEPVSIGGQWSACALDVPGRHAGSTHRAGPVHAPHAATQHHSAAGGGQPATLRYR